MPVAQVRDLLVSLAVQPVISLPAFALCVLPFDIEGREDDEHGHGACRSQVAEVASAVIWGVGVDVRPDATEREDGQQKPRLGEE